jgi:hypothetical protein
LDDTLAGAGDDTAVIGVAFADADATISFDDPNFVQVSTSEGVLHLELIEHLAFTDQTVAVDSLRMVPENPVACGRAYFEGNGFNNPAAGILSCVIVDSEGGNTTRFGQTLKVMQHFIRPILSMTMTR